LEVTVWVLLSSRLRTWLLLAVAVPVLRAVVRRLAARTAERNPGSASAGALGSLDRTLSRLNRRGRSRRR
jgi:hypothetical protein